MAKTGRLPKAKASPSLRHREAKDRTSATSKATTSAASASASAAEEKHGAEEAEAAHAQLATRTWLLGVILACIKTLMIPAYRSTDFEVHRNWLAITHSLPLKDWYYESTSEWTLDYPPFFAYFEYLLSQMAVIVDPEMVVVKNLNYASSATIAFQRLSVIATDFLLVYACKEWAQSRFSQLLSRSRGDSSSSSILERVSSVKHAQMIVVFCLLANFGLFLVDHIHFQYNGFLFGFLLLAITRVFQRRHVEAAFFFASLLNFKHIFVYVAPAFFVYLLKICFSQYDSRGRVVFSSFSFRKLITIGLPVIFSFALSFGPFLQHLPQVLSRLFPFKRGLCHAYWAPNFWALYNVADKALVVALRVLGFDVATEQASMSGGLVREYSHSVLMPITPPATLLFVVVALAPALLNLWRCYPTPMRFVRVLVLCGFAFFLFGWHVHEKAVLVMILPFTLVALETREDKRLFFLLSAVGHFSLFPLIFTPAEAPIKILYYVAFTFASYRFLSTNILPSSSSDKPLLSFAERAYVAGLGVVQAYVGFGHGLLGLSDALPFLPLMIMSCYCSVGIMYVWIRLYLHTTKLPL